MLRVLMPFVRTKSRSMKLSVAPESKSALTECISLVSVVLTSIRRMINVPRASRVLTESCLGNLFSHFGFRGCVVLSGSEGERRGVSIGSQTSVLTSSTSNTANLLTSSDWGTLFAGCAKQNPPLVMGIKRFDHRTKVKARSVRQNLQTASQLCTKQVGTGEINQIIESLLKVKVQRITKTY